MKTKKKLKKRIKKLESQLKKAQKIWEDEVFGSMEERIQLYVCERDLIEQKKKNFALSLILKETEKNHWTIIREKEGIKILLPFNEDFKG